MSEAVQKKIGGVCTEISEKPSGWTTFHIDTGGKWPVKLETKLPDLIAQGRAVGANLAQWTFTEKQGNPNPHNPGTFYMDRLLQGVEVGGEASGVPAGGNEGQQGTSSSIPHTYETPHPGDKDRAIVRQTAVKCAAQLYSGALNAGEQVDPIIKNVLKIATQIEIWIYRDLGGDDNLPFD